MSEYMIFCLGEGRGVSKRIGYQQNHMVFNTKVTDEEYKKIRESLPEIKISHTYWVEEKDMTKEEKKENDQYKQLGGFLKRITYEEAWANWWDDASKKDKQAILDIPYFDAEIFKGITGIEVSKTDTKKQELIDKAEQLQKKAQELLDTANLL